MNKKDKTIFLKCDCNCEAVEFLYDEDNEELYITPWKLGFDGNVLSIKDRIRWCFCILKTGLPWDDCIILGKEKIASLKEFLNSI